MVHDDELPVIEPPRPRWQPNPRPESIFVPGLDTSAPPQDQIEYIEQLITLKLQNVDANFAEAQGILANKILPAFRRYAINTEPVREAAKFWVQFFELAAQVHISTADDDYLAMDSHTHTETKLEEDEQVYSSESRSESRSGTSDPDTSVASFNPDITPSENSFLPDSAAVSSTPLTVSGRQMSFGAKEDESTASWTASLESPFDKLDRELQGFSRENEVASQSKASTMRTYGSTHNPPDDPRTKPEHSTASFDLSSADQTSQTAKSVTATDKGKRRRNSSTLRQAVLQQNFLTAPENFKGGYQSSRASPSAVPSGSSRTSPLKVKPKTPKASNPYIPAHVRPKDWDGIVDLGKNPSPMRLIRAHNRKHVPDDYDSDEEEDAKFFAKFSPPKTMDFARPKYSVAPVASPAKAIISKITGDLLQDVGSKDAYQLSRLESRSVVESSMSTLPTPPSLSRYRKALGELSSRDTSLDASLDNMLKQVGIPIMFGAASTATSFRIDDSLPQIESPIIDRSLDKGAKAFTQPDIGGGVPLTASASESDLLGDDAAQATGSGSDSDESFVEGNSAQPSAAFLMASRRRASDDSFGSSNHSSDSLGEDELVGEGGADQPVIHPFERAFGQGSVTDDSFDDSFDDGVATGQDDEPTIFGVPPAQRAKIAASSSNPGQLKMLGQELLEDTVGYGQRLDHMGVSNVEDTPTPWNMPRGS